MVEKGKKTSCAQENGRMGDTQYQQMKLQIQQRDNEIRVLVSMLQKHEEIGYEPARPLS